MLAQIISSFLMCGDYVAGQLQTLRQDLKVSTKAAHAEGTRRNLRVQWKSFLIFCVYFDLTPLPVDIGTLCLYVQFLSRSFKSVDSIHNYVSGVKFLHILKGVEYLSFDCSELDLALKGIARINKHMPKQALPITPEILLEIHRVLDFDNQLHIVFWSLFLLAFFLMARKSNLVPDSVIKFDPNKQLCRKDILVHKDLLLVCIKWSKTIECRERILQIPILKIADSVLCPWTAYTSMCKILPAAGESPAFVVKGGSKLQSVTYKQLQTFLKSCITKTGRDSEMYSSHSFRRGGASWAFRANVPSEFIQLQGDWRSDAYKQYLHFEVGDRLQVAHRMSHLIQIGTHV
jgi:hypothetical protein